MRQILLIGQALIDYMTPISQDLFKKFNLQINTHNKLDHVVLDQILSEAEILHKDIGGCVTNTAIGLHNLGQECLLIYSTGNDESGSFFDRRIKEYDKISTVSFKSEDRLGIVITFVEGIDQNNPRTCAYNHGCSNQIPFDIRIRENLAPDAIMYLSLFSLFDKSSDGIISLVDSTKSTGGKLVLDLGGIKRVEQNKLIRILSMSDGFIANIFEMDYLKSILNMSSEEISRRQWLVVKKGALPTELYIDGKLDYTDTPPTCNNILNCLGAGDAFSSAFLKEYAQNQNHRLAITCGNMYAQTIIQKKEFH